MTIKYLHFDIRNQHLSKKMKIHLKQTYNFSKITALLENNIQILLKHRMKQKL